MPPTSVLTNAVAFMAFVVAFYALLARERKTPYITNYIFPPAALMFVAVVLILVEQVIQAWRVGLPLAFVAPMAQQQSQVSFRRVDLLLIVAANAFFFIGTVWILSNIWRLHNRQVNFRDDNRIKNLRFVRAFRNYLSRLIPAPSYEHDAPEIKNAEVSKALSDSGVANAPADTQTIALCAYPINKSDEMILTLAAALLEKGWLVQYTTCARHPYEWMLRLRGRVGHAWKDSAQRIAVVDGYTPHFGFTDSIHAIKTAEVRKEGLSYTATPESYAGVHTATAKAFNVLKARSKTPMRPPTLLLYEGCRSLVDLESAEQYRLFLRHVLTSERMWGGMITVFIEPETDDSSMQIIRAYSDVVKIAEKVEAASGPEK